MNLEIQESEIKIRAMKKEDLEKVLLLERDGFSRPWSEKDFLEELSSEQALYLTAEWEGEPVGYCGFFFAGEEADLCRMTVEEKMRAQGIGAMILREGLNRLEEKMVETVFLEVRESNAPAIRLYQKMDFKKISIRKDYYKEPKENAIVMFKNLTNPYRVPFL